MKKLSSLFASVRAYITRHPRADVGIVLASVAAFVSITLGNINNATIWFDEGFTAYISRFSYAEIAQFTAVDVHPPLYYWFVKTWTLLFGTTEFAFRSMSVLFGVIAIVGAYALARRFFGRSVAVASLPLLVLSPMLIRYSDETRMYTMAAAIVVGATLALLKAIATKKRAWWIAYGLLVAIGMWTHYFTAVAWIAHWVWRGIVERRKVASFKQWVVAAFGGRWFMAYGLAVALFLPWVPSFLMQTKAVQSGFWIGPVTADTPVNYLSNFFYYFEHGQVVGWWLVPFLFVLTSTIIAIPRAWKKLQATEKKSYLLVTFLAWLSPLILIAVSLPPLKSVFVERYLIPATVFVSIFFAVTLIVGTRGWRRGWRVAPFVLSVAMMIVGVVNVYSLGNFNKNSNTHVLTGETMREIWAVSPEGTPIIAESPWIFYEAVFYDRPEYPVYFIDEDTDYIYGSLEMLRTRDEHKITDLQKFKQEHPTIWYISNTEKDAVSPYEPSWQQKQTVSSYDPITGKALYKATEYVVSAE